RGTRPARSPRGGGWSVPATARLDRWLSKQNPAYRLTCVFRFSKGPRGPAPAGPGGLFERQRIPIPGRRSAMSIPVITISREYGSGGRAIGEKLAKELGIPFYNKELILMAAKESGLSEEYIKKAEQQKSTSFLYGLYMGAQQL